MSGVNDMLEPVRARISVPAMIKALQSPVRFLRYWFQRRRYLTMPGAERQWLQRLYPMIHDDTGVQDARDFYYYQDCWGARKVFELKPPSVLDLGCTVLLTGIVSQFTPTTSIDIRPVQSHLPGLTNLKGNLMAIPMPDASQDCVLSLCVIEHIGLGRYGDELDPEGSLKAAKEMARVLKKGGHLLISTMVGPSCLAFNAHRIFSVEEFLGMFPGMDVLEELYLYPEPGPKERYATIPQGQAIFYCAHLRKR